MSMTVRLAIGAGAGTVAEATFHGRIDPVGFLAQPADCSWRTGAVTALVLLFLFPREEGSLLHLREKSIGVCWH